jgi:arginine repressor
VQEIVGNTLKAIGIDKEYISRTPAAQQLRERMVKLDYRKLKSFCTKEEIVSKLKRPPTEWEKIFASYISQKGPITKMYRDLKKLNSPKINESIKKWATELNKTSSKEKVQMAKKYMRKCSLSLATKEIQFKTTVRLHLTPVRIATMKNNNKTFVLHFVLS